MPIYEYACAHCGHHFDVMQKITEKPCTQCPSCQQDTVQRLVSAAGFRLKGEGWYETDFKGSDKKKNLATSESEAPAAAATSTSKGDGTTSNTAKAQTPVATTEASKSSTKSETKSHSTGEAN